MNEALGWQKTDGSPRIRDDVQRYMAESQTSLEEARVCVCVVSLGWLRTVTHFKSREWSSQNGMFDSLQLFSPLASHTEVVSAPPLTPFMSDRERCRPEQSSCSLSAFGLLRALGFKVWDVRCWLGGS